MHTKEGIILKKSKVGERDHLLIIYTPHGGKITAIAKGSQKFLSRRRATFDCGNICLFELYDRLKTPIVTQSQLIETFRNTKSNLEGIIILQTILEITDKLTHRDYPLPSHYQSIKEILFWVEKNKNYSLGLSWFIVKTLTLFGLFREVTHCSSCHKNIIKSEESCWLIKNHFAEVFCRNCAEKIPGKYEVSPQELSIINFMQAHELKLISKEICPEPSRMVEGPVWRKACPELSGKVEEPVSSETEAHVIEIDQNVLKNLKEICLSLVEAHLPRPLGTKELIS